MTKMTKTSKKKKRTSGISLAPMLLLIPTVIFGAYGGLQALGYIPKELQLGMITVEFYGLGENALMQFLEKFCFIWMPVLFVAVMILSLVISWVVGTESSDVSGEESNKKSRSRKSKKTDSANLTEPQNSENGGGDDRVTEEKTLNNFPVLKKLDQDSAAKRREARQNAECTPVSLKDMAMEMQRYAASKGLDIPARAIRSLLSAVLSGRMLVIDGRYDEGYKDKSRAVIAAVASYFGGTLHPYSVNSGSYAPEHLTTVTDADGRISETDFLTDIYTACINSENVSLAYLEDFDCDSAVNFFSEYASALYGGIGGGYVTVDRLRRDEGIAYIKNGKVLFPENLILAVSTPFGSDITKVFKEAVYPDISGIVSRPPAACSYRTVSTRAQILKAMERARENFYLSDESWNGVDRLEEYLHSAIGYRFDNRKTRMMERYSSVYMASGGSEKEALDSMLVACVLSELYPKRGKINENSGAESLPDLLERVFGSETVPASVEAARRICGGCAKAESKAEAQNIPPKVTETPETHADFKTEDEDLKAADGSGESEELYNIVKAYFQNVEVPDATDGAVKTGAVGDGEDDLG